MCKQSYGCMHCSLATTSLLWEITTVTRALETTGAHVLSEDQRHTQVVHKDTLCWWVEATRRH